MAPTLNQDDIKLLKGIFATKDDLKNLATKKDLKKTETKLIKRMDYVDKVLDKEHVKLAKEVDRIKVHVGLPILN